ncbi:MAG: sulfotransferase domain-containing protein [Chloroflexi bacterium]|nr:sulfotransferase domain-containing protein [Chloroflexota bacterium]
MRAYYSIKHALKRARWQARRGRVVARWGRDELRAAPIVFGNAMPKSGSHLLNQILVGLTRIGPFVKSGFPPVTRFEDNTNLPEQAVLANLQRMQPGDVGYGYLRAKEPFLTILAQSQFASVFVYRDPRDVLVSHVFYATEMYQDHGMRRYYLQLNSVEERINAAIQGVQASGFELPGIRDKYKNFLGWLDQPEILSLRFEDLILERESALNRLLDHLASRGFTPNVSRQQAVQSLSQEISPHRSGTFRKGQPGDWREHFTASNKRQFKQHAGELLLHLGYEQGADW